MAEAAGLTIGALALASLFSTCIELVDCFELARNHVYEYNLACTKIGLLRARLSVWGNELSLEMPGHEHPALRDSWPREREAISCGLFNIKALFEDASLLRDKYDLSPQHPRALKPVIPRRLSWFKTGSKGSTSLTVTKLASLRRRTVWAIHDKQKFDSFIQNLSFLIENLEKVTKRIKMPTPQKETEAGEYSSNTLRKLVPKPQDQEKPSDQKDVPKDLPDLSRILDGNVFLGSQDCDGLGVMGTIDCKKRHLYSGNQTIRKGAFAIMGSTSEKAVLAISSSKGTSSNSPDDAERGET